MRGHGGRIGMTGVRRRKTKNPARAGFFRGIENSGDAATRVAMKGDAVGARARSSLPPCGQK
jgi:hypothetical protein